jgi:phage terminase large subunit-like protein
MCDFLNVRVTPSRKKLLSVFRLSFKTTVLQGFFGYEFVWSLVDQYPTAIVYNTATKENSSNFQESIKHDLTQNEFLRWIFPELPKSEGQFKTMTKQKIQHGHTRLEFASLDTVQVGRHAPTMVNDDLENDENAFSDTLREELKRKWKFQKAILTKIKSKGLGLEIDIGTPYHFQGLVWKLMNMPTYDKMIVPCWYEREGKRILTMPEVYEESDFLEKREEVGAAIFSSQYLLHPLPEEDALCQPGWLRYYTTLPENSYRTMIIDPGGSDPKTKDSTGISIVDTDEKGDMYVVYYRKLWLSPVELMNLVGSLKEQYRPDGVWFEKEKYSTTIADIFRHRFPLLNFSFVEHKLRRKPARIWRLKQLLQSGRVYIPSDNRELESDLLQYPHLDYDDGLDSLAYHLDVRRTPPKIQKPRFEPRIEPTFDMELDKYLGLHTKDGRPRTEADDIY